MDYQGTRHNCTNYAYKALSNALVGTGNITHLALTPAHLIPLYKNTSTLKEIKGNQISMYFDNVNNEYYDDNFSLIAKYSGSNSVIAPKIESHNEVKIYILHDRIFHC